MCPGTYINGIPCTPPPPPLSVRDRDLPSGVAVFHEHGGVLPGAGRPAAGARGRLPVPRLAGPPGRHHLPARADAVLHLVSWDTPDNTPPHTPPFPSRTGPTVCPTADAGDLCSAFREGLEHENMKRDCLHAADTHATALLLMFKSS